MKTLIALMLVFVSTIGYSQTDADRDNLSHPFEIFYVEDASLIGRQEKLEPFQLTNRYGLIRNHGKLILLHYTGYLYETTDKLIDIREIAEPLETSEEYIRPPISPHATADEIASWQFENKYHPIKLMYPWKHTIQLSKHERLPIQWYYEGEISISRKTEFEITVRDLHDKVLLRKSTSQNYFEIDLENIELPENLIICHISLPETGEVSDDIIIAFEQEHQVQSTLPKHYSVTKYQSFIDGLIAMQKNKFDLATKLFHLAIDTHDDPEFDILYRRLLDEYPKLRLALE